ncbi:MAG: copper resistance CopC family protein [Steroidobacteraceae bacterium]
MKPFAVLSALALLASMTVAQAHAHLRASNPASGSEVTAPPSQVVLRFSEAARLTAAWIARNDAARQSLRPLPSTTAVEAILPMPALVPGRYVVSWRAMGADGHIVPGQIEFTVRAPGAPPGVGGGPSPR